jgi:uncharacterized protein GlcG (DUF336 family)
MPEITLEEANKMVDWALNRALEIGLRPITCCVTNSNAALKVFKAQEETPMMRYELCYGKAFAALALGRSTSLIRARAEDRPLFHEYLSAHTHHKLFPEKGGMLIRDDDGTIVGALAVTGATADQDEELAGETIRACGYKTCEDVVGIVRNARVTMD